ncbi:MAG: DUF2314 domain-containing protein [Verrucomicrobiales bacterium]|nr:DUF2314 domain-containing protein [Verrucomicrobiales bacterium]
MFNLFGKKKPNNQPHPLKVNFAKIYIPTCLQDMRSGFINAMASDEAIGVLSRGWTKFGEANLPKNEMLKPIGLDVTVFREQAQIIIALSFPEPTCEGEPFFSGAVIDLPDENDRTEEAMNAAPYRYFVSSMTTSGTEIEELVGEDYCKQGNGPEADLHLFIEWVMNAAVRDSSIMSVRSEDEDMKQAVERARATLPAITEKFLAGELENFIVKMPISDGNATEHFWLVDLKYHDGKFSGAIEGEPQTVQGVEEGQCYEVAFEEVTDWMHIKDGLIYGNYSLRVLLPSMPPAKAQLYADRFAPAD